MNNNNLSKADTRMWSRRFWRVFLAGVAAVFLLFILISLGWLGFMPSFRELENPKSSLSSEVYTADGALLGKYFIENRSNVSFSELSPHLVNAIIATEDARFEQHSGIDVKAIFRAVYGKLTGNSMGGGSTLSQQLAKNLFPRKRNLNFVQTVFVKLKEWVTATKLERNFTKQEIIAMYFNTVDFGNNAFGIKTAANTYFAKTPDQLDIEEAALLVGILKAPTFYSPTRNPENALRRREVVLNQMEKYGYITSQQYDELRVKPLDMTKFRVLDHNSGMARYFREQLRLIMAAHEPDKSKYADKAMYYNDSILWETSTIYGWLEKNRKPDGSKYDLYTDGLKIYTTIDPVMQKYAEEAVAEHLGKTLQNEFFRHWRGNRYAPFDFPSNVVKSEVEKLMNAAMRRSDRYISMKRDGASEEEINKAFNEKVEMRVFTWRGEKDTILTPMDSIRYYKHYLQAGLMSIDPHSGYVKAYVGGIDYKHFKYDHVFQAKRQVGSTFKPFVYTLAMQEGDMSPCSMVPNVPVTIQTPSGPWTPRNAGSYRSGQMVSLREALANSINWISAYLIKRYSAPAVINIARKMGIRSPMDPVPAISLGTPDISLYEMVGAMSTFANKGVHIEPIMVTRIEDHNGHAIGRYSPTQSEAMSAETAFLMLELMKGVVDEGTGQRLRRIYNLQMPIAGKTGTTQNNSDGWFMGLTPDLVTGIWVGGEDRSIHFRNMAFGQGAAMALPIWGIYMKKVYADNKIQISQEDFEKPDGLDMSVNCGKSKSDLPKTNVDRGRQYDLDEF